MSSVDSEWVGTVKTAKLLGWRHQKTWSQAKAGKLGPMRTDERGNIYVTRAEIEKRRLLTPEEFARVMAFPTPRNESRDRERLRHAAHRRDP